MCNFINTHTHTHIPRDGNEGRSGDGNWDGNRNRDGSGNRDGITDRK